MILWALWGLEAKLHGEFHVWALIPFPVGPISPAASGQAPPGPVHPLPGSVYSRPRPARPCLALAWRRLIPACIWPWPGAASTRRRPGQSPAAASEVPPPVDRRVYNLVRERERSSMRIGCGSRRRKLRETGAC